MIDSELSPDDGSSKLSSNFCDSERKRLFTKTEPTVTRSEQIKETESSSIAIHLEKSISQNPSERAEKSQYTVQFQQTSHRHGSQANKSFSWKSGMKNHTSENAESQKCFWDWLTPLNLKDATGRRSGDDGFDPSTVLIPHHVYDQMTG